MVEKLKVFADRMSQPSRAVLIFCRLIVFHTLHTPLNKTLICYLFILWYDYNELNTIIIIFVLKRLNGIDFEEIKVDISKGHHLSSQFRGIYSFALNTGWCKIGGLFFCWPVMYFIFCRSKPSAESSGYCSWKFQPFREVISDKALVF